MMQLSKAFFLNYRPTDYTDDQSLLYKVTDLLLNGPQGRQVYCHLLQVDSHLLSSEIKNVSSLCFLLTLSLLTLTVLIIAHSLTVGPPRCDRGVLDGER